MLQFSRRKMGREWFSQAARQSDSQAAGQADFMLSNLEPSHMWDLDLSFMIGTPEGQNALTNNICLGTFPINKRILDRTIRTEHQETSVMQAEGIHSHGVPVAGG